MRSNEDEIKPGQSDKWEQGMCAPWGRVCSARHPPPDWVKCSFDFDLVFWTNSDTLGTCGIPLLRRTSRDFSSSQVMLVLKSLSVCNTFLLLEWSLEFRRNHMHAVISEYCSVPNCSYLAILKFAKSTKASIANHSRWEGRNAPSSVCKKTLSKLYQCRGASAAHISCSIAASFEERRQISI